MEKMDNPKLRILRISGEQLIQGEKIDTIVFDELTYWINQEQAKELLNELSHSYITSEIVKDLLSSLQQFVIQNELVKRTNSST